MERCVTGRSYGVISLCRSSAEVYVFSVETLYLSLFSSRSFAVSLHTLEGLLLAQRLHGYGPEEVYTVTPSLSYFQDIITRLESHLRAARDYIFDAGLLLPFPFHHQPTKLTPREEANHISEH